MISKVGNVLLSVVGRLVEQRVMGSKIPVNFHDLFQEYLSGWAKSVLLYPQSRINHRNTPGNSLLRKTKKAIDGL